MRLPVCALPVTPRALSFKRFIACLLLIIGSLPLFVGAEEPDDEQSDDEQESGLVEWVLPGVEEIEDPRDAEERREDQARLMEIYCRDEQERPESWLDRSHSYISERLCEPAAWFDGFFGDARSFEETPIGTFIRVRNSADWDEDGGWGYGLGVSANIMLPRVSDQLRLLVTRDQDVTGEFRDGSDVRDSDRTRLGLRFIASERARSQFDIDASVGSGLNPELRGRYRLVRGMTSRSLIRATQTGFWERKDGFGITSRLDYEWLPDRDQLIRWTGQGTVSQESEGIDWRTSVIAFRQLTTRTALRSELGIIGYTRPSFEVKEYFAAVRYRRQFLRPWLFFELQPERAWPIDQDTGERSADWRFTLTLEVQFENESSREQRLRQYLGDEEAEQADWDKDEPIPTEAPGDRAFDPVLENGEDEDEDEDDTVPEDHSDSDDIVSDRSGATGG